LGVSGQSAATGSSGATGLDEPATGQNVPAGFWAGAGGYSSDNGFGSSDPSQNPPALRPLTPGEIEMASTWVPNSGNPVDWSSVRIGGIYGNRSFTNVGGQVWMSQDLWSISDFSGSNVSAYDGGVFVHEMTHVWQDTQWGDATYLSRGATTSNYSYSLTTATQFTSLNMEQQAQVVEDNFTLNTGHFLSGFAQNQPSLSTYQSVISQVRQP
jgi:hypothetical protein